MRRAEIALMAWEDEIKRDVGEVNKIVNSFFAWKGKVFANIPDKFTREVMVSDDGNPAEIDLSLRAAVDDFADHIFPISGQLVRFPVTKDGGDLPDSDNYRVRRTRSKHFAILWIDCIDVSV